MLLFWLILKKIVLLRKQVSLCGWYISQLKVCKWEKEWRTWLKGSCFPFPTSLNCCCCNGKCLKESFTSFEIYFINMNAWETSQEMQMLPRSLSDWKSLFLNVMKFCNLSVIVICVTKSLNRSQCLCSHCSHCSHCNAL